MRLVFLFVMLSMVGCSSGTDRRQTTATQPRTTAPQRPVFVNLDQFLNDLMYLVTDADISSIPAVNALLGARFEEVDRSTFLTPRIPYPSILYRNADVTARTNQFDVRYVIYYENASFQAPTSWALGINRPGQSRCDLVSTIRAWAVGRGLHVDDSPLTRASPRNLISSLTISRPARRNFFGFQQSPNEKLAAFVEIQNEGSCGLLSATFFRTNQ